MGFYIQDCFWESISDLTNQAQNEYAGALFRLFFTGEDTEPKNKDARRCYILSRDRVMCARKKTKAANARWDAEADANDDANSDSNAHAEVDAQEDAEADASLKKRERESESKNKPPKRGGTKFVPPSFEEAESYRVKAGLTFTDTRRFLDYYESVGWVQGRGKPIKDWKACMRNWNTRQKEWAKERSENNADFGEYSGSFGFQGS